MKVDFATLARQYKRYQNEYEDAVIRTLRSGWYILGNEGKSFEKAYSDFFGVRFCVGVGNGLDALRLSIAALGIGEDDEVIVPTNTFIATALAVSEAGAKPVFVDSDDYFGIRSDAIEFAITEKTKAIIAVHLYGQPCEIDEIIRIAKKNNLKVVEDCAQAHGAKYKGKLVGTFGDVGCFSFYPMKPIGSFGDSGGIITNDEEIASKIRMLRNYGSEIKYKHDIVGINSRMDEIQAAILNVNLMHLNELNEERKNIAGKYLSGIENPKVKLIQVRPNSEHVYHVFPVICEERNELKSYLESNGIYTQIHYPIPCHLSDCYSDLGYDVGELPVSEAFAKHELSLPIFIGMREEEIQYIINTINNYR